MTLRPWPAPGGPVAAGLVVGVIAAILMIADIVGIGWGAAIGMVGVGLTARAAVR